MTDPDNKPWFGPKRFGWGFRPVAWQGWVVTLAAPLIVLAALVYLRG